MAEPEGHTHEHGGFAKTLTKKAGPAPVYVWVLLGVAALYLLERRKAKAQAAAAANGTDTSAGLVAGSTAIPSLGGAGGWTAGAPSAGPSTNPTVAPAVSSAPLLPYHLLNGLEVDNTTLREAYYGPSGEPATPSPFAGASSWIQQDGKTVYYTPGSFGYTDPTRTAATPVALPSGFASAGAPVVNPQLAGAWHPLA